MPKKYFLELKLLSVEHFAFHTELTTLLHMHFLYSMLSRILEQSFMLNFSSLGVFSGVEEGGRSDISLQCRGFLWAHNLLAKAPCWNFPKRRGNGASCTYRKGYYFYSPRSSTVIKSKMAATAILRTWTRFRPPKIRLHCRLVRYIHQCMNVHSHGSCCYCL